MRTQVEYTRFATQRTNARKNSWHDSRIQEGYRRGTGRVEKGYSRGKGRVKEGYSRGTGRVQAG